MADYPVPFFFGLQKVLRYTTIVRSSLQLKSEKIDDVVHVTLPPRMDFRMRLIDHEPKDVCW